MKVVSGSVAPSTNSTSNTGYMYGCCNVRKRSSIVRLVSGVHSRTLLGFLGTSVNRRSVLTDPSRTTNQCLSTLRSKCITIFLSYYTIQNQRFVSCSIIESTYPTWYGSYIVLYCCIHFYYNSYSHLDPMSLRCCRRAYRGQNLK